MKIRHYGTETEKAINSFGRGQTPSSLIKAYGEVKKAVIMAQQETAYLYSDESYDKILSAVDGIIAGKWNDQFPLSLKQGGAGTSLHMNINEVICSLSGVESLHPLDDMAKFQSTNDTFPTAVIIMVYRQLLELEESVIRLQEILVQSEGKYGSIIITGRTELQDALPITLGQVFASWAGSIERDRWRLHKLKERLRTIPLGGTAVGTCFSASRQYVFKAEQNLRKITGLPLCRSQNLPNAVSSQDILAETASGFRILSLNLKKMTADLLLYTSSLSGEFIHEEMQWGSTIMPFKSNPIILEYVSGLMVSVKHECAKIEDYAVSGQLQLNPYLPFIADSFLSAHKMLKQALTALLDRFFPNLSIDEDKIAANLAESPAMVNTLRAVLEYSEVKELIPLIRENRPRNLDELKKLLCLHTELTDEFLDSWFDPGKLTTYSDWKKE